MKAAFTIATANYLSQAKTLVDSFLRYNPDYQFYIFLLDRVEARFDVSFFSPAIIIEIEELDIAAFDKMLFSYTIFELSNALKPFVAEELLKIKVGIETVVYFDCDIKVYAPFTQVDALLQENNILITPHFFTPLPLDGKLLDEAAFINSGIYNGGFFALKNTQETSTFLQWWKARMEKYCVIDFAAGLFVDQVWWNFVPLYFKGVHLIQDRGYNVAYWNLHERKITWADSMYMVNNKYPLLFFHFSGYDFNKPDILSKHQTRFNFETKEELKDLFNKYHQDVLENKHEFFRQLICHFATSQRKDRFDLKNIKHYLASRKNYPYRLKRIIKKLIK